MFPSSLHRTGITTFVHLDTSGRGCACADFSISMAICLYVLFLHSYTAQPFVSESLHRHCYFLCVARVCRHWRRCVPPRLLLLFTFFSPCNVVYPIIRSLQTFLCCRLPFKASFPMLRCPCWLACTRIMSIAVCTVQKIRYGLLRFNNHHSNHNQSQTCTFNALCVCVCVCVCLCDVFCGCRLLLI